MRLYKYLHPDRIDVLRNGTIRFSSPKVLNDPFELKPHISALAPKNNIHSDFETLLPSLLAEEYAKLPAEARRKVSIKQFQQLAKAHLPQLKAQFQEYAEMVLPMAQRIMSDKFEEMIGILCLTESPASLLMWAHYADSHQGFVVEFDATSPFFDQRKSSEDEFRHLRKVIYRELRPSLVLSEVEDFSPFLTKGVDWSYEAEWRMMLPLSDASEVIGSGPTAIHLFEYPRLSIRSIIMGCRMSESKEDEIRQTLRATDELKEVPCSRVQLDDTHYRLCFPQALG